MMRNKILENHKIIIKAILFAMVPLVWCAIYSLLVGGGTIGDIYLPNSVNRNDEVIYFKEVEGVLKYGIPQGFFGYNESRANLFSFSVWSPVLNVFWCIFGFLFGWNYLSPIICNILLMMLAFFIFAMLAQPSKRQLIILTTLYISYFTATLHILIGLPEATVYFLLIISVGMYYFLNRKFSLAVVNFLYINCFLLTWMRPYYLLLFLLPSFFLYQHYRKRKIFFVGVILTLLGGIGYVFINQNMCAPYFTPLFGKASWITIFYKEGFWTGGINVFNIVRQGLADFLQFLFMPFTGNWTEGITCQHFLIVWVMILVITIYKKVKYGKKLSDLFLNIYYIIYCVIMLFACILIFDIASGQKHLVEFCLWGLFIIAMEIRGNKWLYIAGVTGLLCIANIRSNSIAWKPSFATTETEMELAKGEKQLEGKINIEKGKPSYNNTVIWVLFDEVNGKAKMIPYKACYALPAGSGINLCMNDYVQEGLESESLKSKYILTIQDGVISQKCEEIGAIAIAEFMDVTIYQIR